MKKLLLLPALLLLFGSCEYMLKDRSDEEAEVDIEKKVVLGNDKDDKGCVTSAGYKWSLVRKECIRVFEEGYRLNSVDSLKAQDLTASAYVVFDKDKNEAELYVPAAEKSVLMKRAGEGLYKSGNWSLNTNKNYELRNGSNVLYAAAAIKENRVIGDDWKGEIAPRAAQQDTITQ